MNQATSDILNLIAALSPDDMAPVMQALAARLFELRQAPVAELPDPPEPDVNLTLQETALRLRRSVKWLYRRRASLPFIRKIGPRSYVVSKNGLERWLTRQRS